MKVRRILVPIDFSRHSFKALETATDLAGIFGARLLLLHAVHIGTFFDGSTEPVVPPPEFFEMVRGAARERLEKLAQDARARGLAVDVSVSDLPAVDAIVAAAEDPGADMIVMSSKGLTGLKHLLMGSVAERTIQLAPCPVLTVKPHEP